MAHNYPHLYNLLCSDVKGHVRHTAARMQPGRGCGDRPPGQPLQSLHVTEQHFVRTNISCHDTCDIVYSDRAFFLLDKKKNPLTSGFHL